MVDVRLKGVHVVKTRNASGERVEYHYAWRGGPRITAKPGSAAYVRSFAGLAQTEAKAQANNVQSLIERFSQAELERLSAPTVRSYKTYLKMISAEFGDLPIDALRDPAIRGVFKDWRDGMAANPRSADYAWSVLRLLLSFAIDRGELAVNPCARGGRLSSGTRRDAVWSDEDISRLLAVASPGMRAAVMIALWTGQRQSDILALTWQAVEGGVMRLRQSKTGAAVVVPLAAELRAVLASLPRVGPTVLVGYKKEKWRAETFSHTFINTRKRAGIIGLTFHDLRGSAVTRLSLAGCSIPEIAAITGHSMTDAAQILGRHYLGGSAALAKSAMDKLEAVKNPKM